MRILERDKSTIYYQTYLGKEEKTKEVGGQTIRLGEYEISYSEKQSAGVYVSTPKGASRSGDGKAELEPTGNVSHYRRTLISDKDIGLTINSLVWIDSETEPDYRVDLVGKSYHHFIYIVKEI